MIKKSDFLPNFSNEEAMVDWLRSTAKEKFTDSKKHYYTEDEVNDMSRESCVSGGEILSLQDVLKQVKDLIENGSEETLSIEVPQTAGTKALTETRKQRDIKVRLGYETSDQTVFGIVDEDRQTMRYFSEQGEEVVERERDLSVKEKRDCLGLFMSVAKPAERTGTDN